MPHLRKLSSTQARRLAVTRQRLAGPPLPADADGIMQVMRDLGCVQLDPISAVARSHLLVLWSRIGAYDPAQLDLLLWRDRRLCEYWAHCASIVLTEHYPIHHTLMRHYAAERNAWALRLRRWVSDNSKSQNGPAARALDH